MSYILDALRRADAERERGAVPGIHAQPVPVVSSESGIDARPPRWRWVAVGAGIALLVPLAWQLMGRNTPVAKAPDTIAASPATPAAPPPAQLPAAPPPAAPAPVLAAPPAPAPAPAPPKSAPTPARSARPADVPQAPVRQAKAANATPEETRIVAYNELPDEIRRQLPKLVFGGSVHSEQASDRILIVNSQLLREGETAAPGVVLEQIKRQSAVFKFSGYRYEMTY